jgi:hypothetical protein
VHYTPQQLEGLIDLLVEAVLRDVDHEASEGEPAAIEETQSYRPTPVDPQAPLL